MNQQHAIMADFHVLTGNIVDVAAKPSLRSSITLALVELGHDVKEVRAQLDAYYKKAVN